MVGDNQTKEGGAVPAFLPLAPVHCIAYAGNGERKKNMRHAMSKQLNLPRIQTLRPATNENLAIVAGGPSLNRTYKDISNFSDIMTCGSAHDHAVKLGIKPTYHVECDPDLRQIDCYNEVSDAFYLISSRCHKSMFKKLEGRKVYLWHMWENELGKGPYKGEPAFICGATVVLSAVPIAMQLGYKHLHFFGFDSSFPSFEENHAYPMKEHSQQMTVKVGDPISGKEFLSTATWIGQAQQFQDMRRNWPFRCTVYGDGMIAEMERTRMQTTLADIKAETGATL